MGVRTWIQDWPVYRQLTGNDPLGRGAATTSAATREQRPRTVTADKVVKSVCPYCAVGCAQNVYVRDDRVVQIEGDPDSPVSRGRLCPKGSASLQLTTGDSRRHEVLYRRPYGTDWERLDLDTAMDMVVERVIRTRREGWQWKRDGVDVNRTMGIASLGGATLDNEENYLIKKLLTGLGVIQVENQARVCHSSTVAGLGTSFGRGGATTFLQDLQNADCIVIEGSNFAEAHPVGFQWVMEAKARGAKVIHVDPRFSRTSALADLYVPIRAGTDIAFLGGIINHVLTGGHDFRDYVLEYTNAASIVGEEFEDTEDLAGIFSGLDPETGHYDIATWAYEGAEVQAPQGAPDELYEDRTRRGASLSTAAFSESHGSGGAPAAAEVPTDRTLRHPRCVYQILKRHFSRYSKPWSERKALVWWDADQKQWTGHDIPDFIPDRAPSYRPPEDARGPDALSGVDPFIMQADGKGWLYAPAGLVDGPMPTHYEPQDSPVRNPLYPEQQRNPVREVISDEHNAFHPSGGEPGSEVFPYMITTYRLTEHFTAGGMSRWTPYLAELQPEFFCEVSPELAAERQLEHTGWATLISARGVIEARVMVTERMSPIRAGGRTVHQIGLPYHWGPNGYTRGDAANELTAIALDPNVHIQEVKALSADIRPGRRPRGPELTALLEDYRRRAGITVRTGTEVRG
ncbi:formate dehydrogenase [Streptomyces sp. PRh5]|uniref:molybdopterin-dependent oxidoreductase n=1 Tax=Streptomyces sp. PRh5 TaxID=1158056 RepID=UPI000448555F|nr:molybdopterin-dependent oxidoreductase [Streptomyces sp. PRh5]EXU65102.1 formate dehydrogenase [Streptomyces sp. PRh5]